MNKIVVFGLFLLGLIMLTLTASAQTVPINSFFYDPVSLGGYFTYADNDIFHTRINYRPVNARLYLGTFESQRVSDITRITRYRYFENPGYGGTTSSGTSSGIPLIHKSECEDAFDSARDIRECKRRYEREKDFACGVYRDSSARSRCKRDFDSGRFFEDQRRIYLNEGDFLNDIDVYYDDQYGLDGWYRNYDGSRRYILSN